ncbi:hypothetical protein FRC07_013699 [Ceratobasidium sp. 392]|nr:hypothetical protein FRC07_013699 [Ceratobasidium sp. 392]
MSRTLTALANGQPAPSPPEDGPNSAAFSPPRSAVIVNILWLLSLSLSVAVSLIAMLAKDWCYKFMSGRSGQMFEQARRRQERWNGIEQWKMTVILEQLPGLMHLALISAAVLFAAGMCLYLWNINVDVAIPVVAITAISALAYGIATVSSFLDRFCPYSTPATDISRVVFIYLPRLMIWVAMIPFLSLWSLLWEQGWPELELKDIKSFILNASDRIVEYKNVPMDSVTSQMLAWMITNCEDSRSVDIALQALAGAHDGLPRAPFEQCDTATLVLSRLELSCATFNITSTAPSTQQLAAVTAAGRYLRGAANWLYGGDSVPARYDRWTGYVEDDRRTSLEYSGYRTLYHACAHDEVSIASIESIGSALDHVTSSLDSHLREGGITLSATVLHALVKASVHYLVGRWPREEDHGQHGSLPVLLARVFVTCYGTAPDTAQAAALALAAGAFANYTYPGGEEPPVDVNAREKRAVQVLQHYQANKPDTHQLFALYMFGFYSWLPWFISDGHDEQLAAITRELGSVTGRGEYWMHIILHKDIRTLPPSFSVRDHAIKTVSNFMSSTTGMTQNQTSAIVTTLLLFFEIRNPDQSHIGLYLVALVGLCHTESKDDQKLCMQAIARTIIPFAPLQQLSAVDGQSLLKHLCRTLISIDSAVAPFAAVHFGLLVARIASYEKDSLEDRQSAPLHDWSGDLQGHDAVTLSNLVSHLEEIIRTKSMANSLQRTMQFVANFCSSSPNMGPDPGPASEVPANWWYMLGTLKRQWCYQQSLDELERLYAEQQGGSTSHPPQVVEEELVPASDTTETEVRPDEQVEVADQDTSWDFEGPYGAR